MARRLLFRTFELVLCFLGSSIALFSFLATQTPSFLRNQQEQNPASLDLHQPLSFPPIHSSLANRSVEALPEFGDVGEHESRHLEGPEPGRITAYPAAQAGAEAAASLSVLTDMLKAFNSSIKETRLTSISSQMQAIRIFAPTVNISPSLPPAGNFAYSNDLDAITVAEGWTSDPQFHTTLGWVSSSNILAVISPTRIATSSYELGAGRPTSQSFPSYSLDQAPGSGGMVGGVLETDYTQPTSAPASSKTASSMDLNSLTSKADLAGAATTVLSLVMTDISAQPIPLSDSMTIVAPTAAVSQSVADDGRGSETAPPSPTVSAESQFSELISSQVSQQTVSSAFSAWVSGASAVPVISTTTAARSSSSSSTLLPTTSPMTTPSSSTTSSLAAPPGREGLKIGLGVAIPLCFLLLAPALIFWLWRRRAENKKSDDLEHSAVWCTPPQTPMSMRSLNGSSPPGSSKTRNLQDSPLKGAQKSMVKDGAQMDVDRRDHQYRGQGRGLEDLETFRSKPRVRSRSPLQKIEAWGHAAPEAVPELQKWFGPDGRQNPEKKVGVGIDLGIPAADVEERKDGGPQSFLPPRLSIISSSDGEGESGHQALAMQMGVDGSPNRRSASSTEGLLSLPEQNDGREERRRRFSRWMKGSRSIG